MRPIHKKLILMTSDPRSAMMYMYKHSIRIICIYIIVYIIICIYIYMCVCVYLNK